MPVALQLLLGVTIFLKLFYSVFNTYSVLGKVSVQVLFSALSRAMLVLISYGDVCAV